MSVSARVRATVTRRAARDLVFCGLGLTAITHAAVLVKALPHTAVSGGRVQDQLHGKVIAAASLASLLPAALLTAHVTHGPGQPSRRATRAMAVAAAVCAASVPVQLVGTKFERTVMAPTAAALALGYSRLAVR